MSEIHPDVKAFNGIWPGGYWEGDPRDPHGRSAYSVFDVSQGYADQERLKHERSIATEELGALSALYVTYLMCIRGRVQGAKVLEIGPGRGAWSKAIMDEGADLLYALDALSADHNGFYPYVDPDGKYKGKVQYLQVKDFSCDVPDGIQFDFFFSFGCFCHIRRHGTAEYFGNIYRRMRPGAEGFVMISDYEKMAKALGTPFNPENIVEGGSGTGVPWSHLGVEWFCQMLASNGFTVLNRDIQCNMRDPIVHFRR